MYSADSVYTCDDWYTNGDFCCFDCRQGLRRPVNFWEAVTAEVGLYADQKDKERRAKSVVVSGMVLRCDVDDGVSFQQLCASERSIDIPVVYARRLGVAGSSFWILS